MKSSAVPAWDALLALRPQLRRNLRFRFEHPDQCFLDDPDTRHSYRLAIWQARFLGMLDGKTPVRDAVRVVIATYPTEATRQAIERIVLWLRDESTLLEKRAEHPRPSPLRPHHAPDASGNPAPRRRPGKRRFRASRTLAHLAACLVAGVGVVKLAAFLETRRAALNEQAAETVAASPSSVPVRASCDGVLTEILVHDGDLVSTGDVLVRIENPANLATMEELRRQLGECRSRRDRYAEAGDNPGYSREMERIALLSRQIGENEAAQPPSEIRAPVTGRIEAGIVCGHAGSLVATGDLILNVQPTEDELIAHAP
ncbi:MAG: biotin/lipoyl-binding protein [Verrucomicrobiae bacterium]|nr:biotin/lipoyl-binding protein [Verrucomicrobiae bacterium]MCP5539361.1 biotin/lipoyl-binding protein [Akkermansiaceae bacterium]MCP5549746.1 biotin/lipoyl-binding protein [Akkermansiaceae bacterium]